MKKIKITKEQYDRLIISEQKRLVNKNSEILKENIKEIVFGVAKLMGLSLTGQNEIMAKKALNNAESMKKIKDTLEDKNKVEELIDLMKEKGMENYSTILNNESDKIINNFNKISDKQNLGIKLNFFTKNNLNEL
jgi:hypothetical protein